MAFIKNLEEVKNLCRICLSSSFNMISLDNKVDEKSDDSPQIVDVLENILMVSVENNTDYPVEICQLCQGNLKILHDLKMLYHKSQNILKKYVSSLQQYESIRNSTNTDVLALRSTENIEFNDDMSNENEVEIEDIESINIPKKTVKLPISTKPQNSVSVKWLEGNSFIIEENSNIVNKCRRCCKIFSSKERLSSHLKYCEKTILCKYCKEKFYSERSFRSHLKLHHSSTEIKCELCNKTFKNYNARSYHKITRHNAEGKKYKCEMCGKAFYFKNSLSQHLECHSRDVSRVVCPICGKSFHYRGGLFYHMKIHRNERNYICNYCNGRFLNMASLKRHTRIHTGERPYSCSFCSKTFCSVSEVRTHERRHTGQKPHKCKYCKKCFITPYNLKLHMSSHTGSEPCELCNKSYLNTEVLKYHMEMKHNIKEQSVEGVAT